VGPAHRLPSSGPSFSISKRSETVDPTVGVDPDQMVVEGRVVDLREGDAVGDDWLGALHPHARRAHVGGDAGKHALTLYPDQWHLPYVGAAAHRQIDDYFRHRWVEQTGKRCEGIRRRLPACRRIRCASRARR
jgi:hypothetical protein